MENRLSQNFNGVKLFKFTIPSILSLIFMSMYQMVDAVFVSNYIGENALASINIVYPVFSVVLAVTLMLSTGGSAVVAKKMGEGKGQEAKENFSALVLVAVILSTVISVGTAIFIEPLLRFLGATPLLHKDCIEYLSTLMPFFPAAALQLCISTFLIAAGKPGAGFLLTAISGGVNVVLDYLFIVELGLGIQGSAIATAIGYLCSAVPGVIYFFCSRKGSLYFVKPKLKLKLLAFACFNGSSEMISNLSISVTTLLFNKLALHYMGEAGVTAITVTLYAQFFLTAVFMGYIGGAGPVFSFHFGSRNQKQLSCLFRSSFLTVLLMTVLVIISSYGLSGPIVAIFIRPESSLFPLAIHGFRLFALSYLFAGFNIYASGLFTSLQNGVISSVISVLRTFVFLVAALIGLPYFIGEDGIWLAVPVAEAVSCIVSAGCILLYRKRYFFTLKKGKETQEVSQIEFELPESE